MDYLGPGLLGHWAQSLLSCLDVYPSMGGSCRVAASLGGTFSGPEKGDGSRERVGVSGIWIRASRKGRGLNLVCHMGSRVTALFGRMKPTLADILMRI